MRKIALSLLCAGALISNTTMAMTHSLSPQASVEYELAANKPEVFTNFTIFKVHAVCKVQTQDESNTLHVKGLYRSGQVNGKVINAGDEVDIIVRNGDSFDLVAEAAAQVELTNIGVHSIKTKCQVS
ncbi:hypothetical protein ACNVED_05080 [Legionella sp. D16C41]|uniref:hypothetical protein n=1 Tax=Legionella sp. D16C41 TaxID=3402688 RepID=UPI003AF7C6FC